ncbi:MAG: hypothetical protein ABI593_11160 [Betaproteobacteria bacterium]
MGIEVTRFGSGQIPEGGPRAGAMRGGTVGGIRALAVYAQAGLHRAQEEAQSGTLYPGVNTSQSSVRPCNRARNVAADSTTMN